MVAAVGQHATDLFKDNYFWQPPNVLYLSVIYSHSALKTAGLVGRVFISFSSSQTFSSSNNNYDNKTDTNPTRPFSPFWIGKLWLPVSLAHWYCGWRWHADSTTKSILEVPDCSVVFLLPFKCCSHPPSISSYRSPETDILTSSLKALRLLASSFNLSLLAQIYISISPWR